MRSGVSFPSYASQAVWASLTHGNLVRQSQTFGTTWSAVQSVVASDVATAPDGTATADRLTDNATNSQHRLQQGLTTTANVPYTHSVFVKADGGNFARVRLLDSTPGIGFGVFIDLTTGQVIPTTGEGAPTGTAYGAVYVGNGWWFVWVTMISTGTGVSPFINTALSMSNSSYLGTGALSILLWGSQVTQSTGPLPYVPTTTVAISGVAVPADANFPVTNLSDLYRIRMPAKWSAANGAILTFTFPAAQSIQFLGICNHNAPDGATFQLGLFNDASPSALAGAANQVFDSGVQDFWPSTSAPVSGYLANRPYLMAAAVSARSGVLVLSDRRMVDNIGWILGGIELGDFWEWTDVAVPREFGLLSKDSSAEMPFNIDHTTAQWSPRIIRGSRELVDQDEVHTTLLDFQLEKGNRNPFVWAWDLDDSATWARQAILVRNADLPPGEAIDYPAGRMSFSFVEHLR